MAILTVSRQFGSRGDDIARQLARRTGFRLVTRETIEGMMASRGMDPAVGETRAELNVYADRLTAIVADMAAQESIVLVGRGGQFLFREAACAMHVRVVAPKSWRAATVAAELALAPPAAAEMVAQRDALQARYLRAVFHRSPQPSDLYHMVLNTAALDLDHASGLAMSAVETAMLPSAGLLTSDAAQRLKVRSKMSLARHFATRPSSSADDAFAHPSERVFARLLDFYGIEWQYEPRTFPIEWNEQGELVEAFTPDFYLPEQALYVELTTMKQSLVTRKNRKVKLLRELYPDINIRIFYQKDVEDLVFKLGTVKSDELKVKT